ncbi:MAG: hypothetical protein K0R38_786 [Polyangiaceae bacterium]|nr:hypothetical protein [Polyangiaceae bacterium]
MLQKGGLAAAVLVAHELLSGNAVRQKVACGVIAILTVVKPCAAQPKTTPSQVEANAAAAQNLPRPSMWKRHWPTFSAWEGAATVMAGVGTAALFLAGPPREARWEGGILFDDAVRDGIRADSDDGRKTARGIGDIPYFAAPVLPLLVDPLLAAWLVRGDTKAALNLELVGLQSFAYSGLLSYGALRGVARERPDSSECRRQNPGDPSACEVDTESFFSGHTAIVATSAGLTCANHRYLPLWGHPLADAGACLLATGGAVTTAITRVVGDRHYATDVLLGFGIGFGVGYAVPTLLHYSRGRNLEEVSVSVSPGGGCLGACLKVAGKF